MESWSGGLFKGIEHNRKWNKIGVLTIIMELEYAESGVLAPTEAVLAAPKKWVKGGWGGITT